MPRRVALRWRNSTAQAGHKAFAWVEQAAELRRQNAREGTAASEAVFKWVLAEFG